MFDVSIKSQMGVHFNTQVGGESGKSWPKKVMLVMTDDRT